MNASYGRTTGRRTYRMKKQQGGIRQREKRRKQFGKKNYERTHSGEEEIRERVAS
jgi:hypothetical protein